MIPLDLLPGLNATLNATSAVLLIAGYFFIRRKNTAAHKACMLSALGVSSLFLTSYLYLHYNVGSTHFAGEGWIRPVYFTLLLSHTILAAAIVPLALTTFYRAFKEQFDRHRRIARWTLPLWIYVSVTGVLIYFFLYHWFPAP